MPFEKIEVFFNIIILLNILDWTQPNHSGWARMGLARLGQVRLTSGPTYFALFFFLLGWAKHVQPISFLIERDERQQNVSQFTSRMPHLEEKKKRMGIGY
jgi:hypothetical protein